MPNQQCQSTEGHSGNQATTFFCWQWYVMYFNSHVHRKKTTDLVWQVPSLFLSQSLCLRQLLWRPCHQFYIFPYTLLHYWTAWNNAVNKLFYMHQSSISLSGIINTKNPPGECSKTYPMFYIKSCNILSKNNNEKKTNFNTIRYEMLF